MWLSLHLENDYTSKGAGPGTVIATEEKYLYTVVNV